MNKDTIANDLRDLAASLAIVRRAIYKIQLSLDESPKGSEIYRYLYEMRLGTVIQSEELCSKANEIESQ